MRVLKLVVATVAVVALIAGPASAARKITIYGALVTEQDGDVVHIAIEGRGDPQSTRNKAERPNAHRFDIALADPIDRLATHPRLRAH